MTAVTLVITRSPQVRPRRRAPRLSLRLAGRLLGRVAHPVTVTDLSATGCLVQCGTLLDHGAILNLAIEIDGAALDARVKVAEACVDGAAPEGAPRYLAGLEFLGLTPLAADRLRRFLDQERRRRQRADAPAQ
jgi:hypothetical protein